MESSGSADSRNKVWRLVKDMKVAMFVTRDASGAVSARPMPAVNRDFADRLWFMTAASSPSLVDLRASAQALVAYAEPRDHAYVTVRGRARVVSDSEKIRELWSEAARAWFPAGPDSSDIALIEVMVGSAGFDGRGDGHGHLSGDHHSLRRGHYCPSAGSHDKG